MNGLRLVNPLACLFLVDIHHHRWFIGTRGNGIVVSLLIVNGHHMRRRKAIVAMRMTVVQRNIMKYMQPPANVISLDQPYRKDCTGEDCWCLWREDSHDLGCLVEMGHTGSVADRRVGDIQTNSLWMQTDPNGRSLVWIRICVGQ